MEVRPVYLLAGVLVAGALAYAVSAGRRTTTGGGLIFDAAESIGGGLVGGVVDAVDGVITGGVNTVGQVVGLEKTDCQKCADLMNQWAAADLWDKAVLAFKVSAACPAMDYLRWLGDSGYRPVCSQ